MKVTFDHTTDEAKNIRSFWFKPERPIRYQAGQFTEIRLPHQGTDSRGDKRWFTLSSSPTEELLSITTKFTVAGPDVVEATPGVNGSSFKNALRALQPGQQLNLADPMGDFVLPKDASLPLVFIAGGIGVTPFRSMIKSLNDSGEKRDIQLLYAVNSNEEVAFRSVFDAYDLKPILVLANPPEGWQGLSGRLDAATILANTTHSDNSVFYLSGPEPMIEALNDDLKSNGINKRQIRTDFFPGYAAV